MKLKNQITSLRQTARSKQFIKGVVISVLLIASPYFFYLYELAPDGDTKIWETRFFTLHAGGYFHNVLNFVHASFTKLLGMFITTIWFFTCKHWWRIAILVPFTLYLYQFFGVINTQASYFDHYNFWTTSYITLPIVFIYYVIARKLNHNKINKLDALDKLDEELEAVIKNQPN